MAALDIIFGFIVLLAGRNFFWLCVGVVGFLIGMQYAPLLGFETGMTALIVAFALGILGAILAVFFEWFAVVFGIGFLGGGYLLMNMLSTTPSQALFPWLIFIAGGILGMCLMIVAFDLTLIVLSSFIGSFLIVNAFDVTPGLYWPLFIVSVVVGVLVQYATLRNGKLVA